MLICKNCGAECPDQATFCTQCGASMTVTAYTTQNQSQGSPTAPVYEAAPAYEAPVYEAPAYDMSAPTYAYAPPVAPTGSKAPAIVGMIFGIASLILSFSLLITIIGLFNLESASYYYDYYYYYDYSDEIISSFIGFSIFLIPSLIVGLVTSFIAKSGKGMALAGKITSFIALGLTSISFIMTLSA